MYWRSFNNMEFSWKIHNMMFKEKGGGGQRLFEQCSKKLHFWYALASLVVYVQLTVLLVNVKCYFCLLVKVSKSHSLPRAWLIRHKLLMFLCILFHDITHSSNTTQFDITCRCDNIWHIGKRMYVSTLYLGKVAQKEIRKKFSDLLNPPRTHDIFNVVIWYRQSFISFG